jgi:hypothetical protein
VEAQWPDYKNQAIELIGPKSSFQGETTEPLPSFLVAV